MSVYPITSLRQARAFMALKKWEVPRLDEVNDVFTIKGQGSDEVWDAIDNLADALKPFESNSSLKPEFDSEAREIVHRHLNQLGEDVLSDADFWRFLSAVKFRGIVAKRHPLTAKSSKSDGVDGNWANFGALRSSVRESLFFRLFVGAELAYDEADSKDPYHLSRVHDVDLWQSHIVRVFTGDNPEYARSLIRWFQVRTEWYARCIELNVESLFADFNENPETKHLRDFVKRVRRLRSNVVHEFLTEAEVQELVENEALASLRNIESWGVRLPKNKRRN